MCGSPARAGETGERCPRTGRLPSQMGDGLRIAFLTPRFHPQAGGAETYTRYLLQGLVATGHSVDVVAGADPDVPRVHDVDGVRVHRPGPARREATVERLRWFPGFVRAAVRRLDEI